MLRAANGADKCSLWAKPWIIKDTGNFKKIFTAEFKADDTTSDALLSRAMTRWKNAFPKSAEAMAQGKVIAPLLASMGLDSAISAFTALAVDRVVSRLPSYNSMADQPTAFGALKDSVEFGTDPGFFGTLLAVHSGMFNVLAMSASDVLRFQKEVAGHSELTWPMFKDVLKNLTEADLKSCKDKNIHVFHGSVEPGMMLYTPPGYSFGTTVSSQVTDHVAAVKMYFLPGGESLKALSEQYTAIAKFGPEAKERKQVDMLLDVITVALQ